MSNLDKKTLNKGLRKGRVRSKISGTADRPRLTVSISNMHISVQLIDDAKQHTIASSSTVGGKYTGTTTERAALIGTDIAKKAKKAKIETVVFDRNGHKYAKRLRALADAARKEGLRF
ncbi:MAG TPA: 50S ribosomal protein L18 [Candidatus Saccharimonadales bacterium]|nr:50S ribosomal protein L18 [Candidatus Saccharimonadales bacterium]